MILTSWTEWDCTKVAYENTMQLRHVGVLQNIAVVLRTPFNLKEHDELALLASGGAVALHRVPLQASLVARWAKFTPEGVLSWEIEFGDYPLKSTLISDLWLRLVTDWKGIALVRFSELVKYSGE